MPPKRRLRNGNYITAAHILKPLISSSLPSAAAVASTVTALANGGSGDFVGSYGVANGSTSPALVSPATSTVPLTVKQQQQLERNAYLTSLTKDQLKVECRKRGQRIAGNKMDLVN